MPCLCAADNDPNRPAGSVAGVDLAKVMCDAHSVFRISLTDVICQNIWNASVFFIIDVRFVSFHRENESDEAKPSNLGGSLHRHALAAL